MPRDAEPEAPAGGAGVRAAKAVLRARQLAWRSSLDPPAVARRSGSVAAAIAAWPVWREAGAVLLYLATPREVQTIGLIRALLAAGRVVAAPGLDGVLRRLPSAEAYRRSERRVPEPDPALCAPIDPALVDLALLPGLAFDPAGGRLGRGGGFYDRLLPLLACPTCGLCFREQVVEHVPAESWDRPVGYLATEDGVRAAAGFAPHPRRIPPP